MIEADQLTKQRGDRTVVSDVTFRCEPGTVTGFLGPNGAGKTTTMRMLVGLSEPDRGESRILGGRYRDLPNPGRRVGILLDASAQHPGRRGREALAVSARTMGVPIERVDTLLELVGLDEVAARRRVGQYSLGMRQRLGFAHALLGDPEVLILDEPANGLDPDGMRWMRGLLRDFADRGGTVLLSSHLLAEVEAVADRMMIIGGGRMQAQGTRAELLCASGTIVEADDLAALDAAMRRAGLMTQPVDGDRRLVEAEPEVIARAAMADGVVLRRLAPAEDAGLERLFFELTTAGGGAPSLHDRAGPPRADRSTRMSTTTLAGPIRAPNAGPDARPGLGRLVAVELRKMVNTRAGFWLQIAIVALTALVVGARSVTGDGGGPHLRRHPQCRHSSRGVPAAGRRHPARHLGVVAAHRDDHVRTCTGPLTRPGSQARREPLARRRDARHDRRSRRRRSAGRIGRRRRRLDRRRAADRPIGRLPGDRNGHRRRVRRGFLASTPAIVALFTVPTAWAAIASLSVFTGVAPWLDTSRALDPLHDEVLSATQWAHAATALALWMVLPLLIGTWRITRREVSV